MKQIIVEVKDGSDFVGKYEYDRRGRRIIKKNYVAGVLDHTRDFYYSNSWQLVEEFIDGNSSPDQTYVWGIRYVVELIARGTSSAT